MRKPTLPAEARMVTEGQIDGKGAFGLIIEALAGMFRRIRTAVFPPPR